jgi:hypothetical protein
MTRLPFDPAMDYYRVLGVKPNATAEEIRVRGTPVTNNSVPA